jgi:type IV secretory pathway VirD2 relaxase
MSGLARLIGELTKDPERIGRMRTRPASTPDPVRRSLARSLQRMRPAMRSGGASGRVTRNIGRSAFVREPLGFAQRVVVKAHIVKHVGTAAGGASLARHVAYLGREGTSRDGERGQFYTRDADAVNAREITKAWSDDRHHFRFIISPENAQRIADLQGYVRDVMATVERDLRTKLDWIAVDHHNTDNPHSHVLIRGRDDRGADLVIGRDYIAHGFRGRAAELATELLGERSLNELQQALRREVDANRLTSLDRTIARRIDDGVIDLRPDPQAFRPGRDDLLRGRMQHLESLKLAERTASNVWRVTDDWQKTLRDLGISNDIIKQMHDALGRERALRTQRYTPESGRTVAGRVVDVGPTDELSDRRFVVIEDAEQRQHYADLGRDRRLDDIERGSLVRVAPAATTGRADRNIARIADRNDGIYDAADHRDYVDRHVTVIPEPERDRYIDAHRTRLETLARAGIVERLGDDRYEIPEDIVARGAELSERLRAEHGHRAFAKLEIISAEPVAAQVSRHAFTWLDREIERTLAGRSPSFPYDRQTADALDRREDFLVREGYARDDGDRFRFEKGARAELRENELKEAARRYTHETNRERDMVLPGTEVDGTYAGRLDLNGGRTIIVDRGVARFALVRGDVPRGTEPGERLFVTTRENDNARIEREVELQLERSRERDLGLEL